MQWPPSLLGCPQARPSHLVSGVGQPRSLEDRVLVAGRTLEDTTLLQHRVVEDRLMGQPRVLEDRLLGQPRVLEDRTQLAGRTLEDSRTLVALLQPGGRTRLGQRPMKNVNLPHKVHGTRCAVRSLHCAVCSVQFAIAADVLIL